DVIHMDAPVEPWPVADGIWADRPGVLLGVAAADCVPVLVADANGAIGAAHAGWLGTSLRVAAALVETMVAGGARRERPVAALGPAGGPGRCPIAQERRALVASPLGPSTR